MSLERCVLPRDSFCHDLEDHCLSRCSVNFDFWKKNMWHEIFCWTEKFIVMSWFLFYETRAYHQWCNQHQLLTFGIFPGLIFSFYFPPINMFFVCLLFCRKFEYYFKEETQKRRLLLFRYSLKLKLYLDLFIFDFQRHTREGIFIVKDYFLIFPWPFCNQI